MVKRHPYFGEDKVFLLTFVKNKIINSQKNNLEKVTRLFCSVNSAEQKGLVSLFRNEIILFLNFQNKN